MEKKVFGKREAQRWLEECWMGDWLEGCDDANLVALVAEWRGVDEEDKDNYRTFYFHRMTEWRGIEPLYKVNFELDFQGYPSDKEILERLYELQEKGEPLDYTIILEEER